jgi:hypothetical protein
MLYGLLALLGGAAFWWWRLKMIGEAASEAHDVAGRAWGKYKRNKFRKKVEDSPVEAVTDPAAAAVVLMYAMAKEGGPLSRVAEDAIRHEATDAMMLENPTELLVFGKWVSDHVQDVNNVILRYSKLWAGGLTPDECADLVRMVERVAEVADVPPQKQKQALSRLRERLGLTA